MRTPKIKKFISLLLALVFSLSLFNISVVAADHTDPIRGTVQTSDITVTDVLTYDEMLAIYYGDSAVAHQFVEAMPKSELSAARANHYRVAKVELAVTNAGVLPLVTYHPTLEFYLETSESGAFWGILEIYGVKLNRRDDTLLNYEVKIFDGTIDVWLRSADSIEYAIDGDFYNTGSYTSGDSTSLNILVGGFASLDYSVSSSSTSSYFGYIYQHETFRPTLEVG